MNTTEQLLEKEMSREDDIDMMMDDFEMIDALCTDEEIDPENIEDNEEEEDEDYE